MKFNFNKNNMMKNSLRIVTIACVATASFLLTSCLGVRESTTVHDRPMNADAVRLDLKMDDFQLIGEENLNIVYRKYLGVSSQGLITLIDSINGAPVERRNIKTVRFNAISPFNTLLSRAMAPVIEKYPDADFVSPVYSKSESQLMFGGSKNKLSVKVKIYKFKQNK